MKSTWKSCRTAIKAVATLSVIAALLSLPYLNYSRAHLHVFYGAVVAHWHQENGLAHAATGKKTPVSRGNHSLSDLFNLWNIDKNQGAPAVQQQARIFYTLENKILAVDCTNHGTDLFRSPSGRSPPVDFALL